MTIHEEKLCKRCNTLKSSNEFYRRRNNEDLSPYCKPCSNAQSIERQRTLKQKAIEYLGGKCVRCGYDKCPAALDFHHKDPSQKEFEISKVRSTSWNDEIKIELDKCDLLCANCHREAHWEQKEFINLSPRSPTKIYRCNVCETQISNKAKMCSSCESKQREKVSWPTKEELIKMVEETSYSAVGKNLGVSDNAVRKRINKSS
jgi:RecJ-like exonuclease